MVPLLNGLEFGIGHVVSPSSVREGLVEQLALSAVADALLRLGD
jgi:hypothetical protein